MTNEPRLCFGHLSCQRQLKLHISDVLALMPVKPAYCRHGANGSDFATKMLQRIQSSGVAWQVGGKAPTDDADFWWSTEAIAQTRWHDTA